jgi:SNF2 family DNA or RNA helicase
MTPSQRDLYDQVKAEMLELIDSDDFDSIVIFRMFSALQQVVSGFYHGRRDNGTDYFIEVNHNRIGVLLQVLDEIPAPEKVVIWAKYRYDIDQIGATLESMYGRGRVAYFHGGLSEKRRNKQVRRFRSSARFFLATPSCGGHGLTLNESAFTIVYNNGFKYAERLQAEDRNHRLGQERPVTYVSLECVHSIDERIGQALARKGDAVEDFKHEVDLVKGKKNKLKKLIEDL